MALERVNQGSAFLCLLEAEVCSPRQGQTPAHSRCFANVRSRWLWAEHRACLSLSLSSCRVHRAGRAVGFWEEVAADRVSRFLPPLFLDRPLSAGRGWGPRAPGLALLLPTAPASTHTVKCPTSLVWFKVELPGGGWQARLLFLAPRPGPSRQLSRKQCVLWTLSSLRAAFLPLKRGLCCSQARGFPPEIRHC